MTDSNSSLPPAGWYPDPAGSNRTRWWNGFSWSDTYGEPAAPAASVAPVAPVVPAAPAYPAYPAAPAYAASTAYSAAPAYALQQPLEAPAGTSPYTPWIWILAFLPVIGLIDGISSLVNFDDLVADAMDPQSTDSLVGSLISGGIAWVTVGLSVLFGILDWRALKKAGVPRPFHWAWIFFAVISVPVYVVGRSIIVRRRVGSGLPPMIISIVLTAAGFALGIATFVAAIATAFDSGLVS